jgi:hypothetical protein
MDGRNRVVYLGEAASGLDPAAGEADASPQATNETGPGGIQGRRE